MLQRNTEIIPKAFLYVKRKLLLIIRKIRACQLGDTSDYDIALAAV